MLKRITEIGVAVRDLKASVKKFRTVLGGEASNRVFVKKFDICIQMIRVGNIDFELMEPLHPDSLVARYLQKRGEGLHHIAFEVNDVVKSIQWIKDHQVRIIEEKPVFVNGLKAVFLHPQSLGGVLFEIIEGEPKLGMQFSLPNKLKESVSGRSIGACGIVEVGIFVDDLKAVSTVYHKVFLSHNSKWVRDDRLDLKWMLCRIGNVNLRLMEIHTMGSIASNLFPQNSRGLYHVTLRVSNIQQATAYLKKIGIYPQKDPLAALAGPHSLFIPASELNGVRIRLSEKTNSEP
jgi:methylmalonyl-CoA/ethylmalonyl-CoA epimerase